MKNVLAFDLGASSGRGILGTLDNGKITLTEVCRFDNEPVRVGGTLYWDILRLYHCIKQGLIQADRMGGFDSVGIDTWGVDYGLIAPDGALLENPVHYRDTRTDGIADEVIQRIGAEALYAQSGTQVLTFNTLFQLIAGQRRAPGRLDGAQCMLFIPDLLNYFLTGNQVAERTIASTSQLLRADTRGWNTELMERMGIPTSVLPPLVPPGTQVGMLQDALCEELQIAPRPVIAVAAHDTASAVAAVPTRERDFIYISCGTWSLFGTELDSPVLTAQAQAFNLTNEMGYPNTTRFLSNIIGMWLIQETRRQFRREGREYSYSQMEQMARGAQPFLCLIDPDAAEFVPQGNIPRRIREYCRRTGQTIPEGDAQVIRCIYDSIALKYRLALGRVEKCTGRKYHTIHMVGGGTQAELLCQHTADATGCRVVAGPVEATAIGNVVVQLISQGALRDLAEARQVIADSFGVKEYLPDTAQKELWVQTFDHYRHDIIKTEE